MWNCIVAFVDHWQTLFAGLLGLAGGFVAYRGALRAAKQQVKAANETADREITAATDAANRQIAAAREQTDAAQDQTQRMREMERRRVAREAFAFYAMLEAAMGAVLEDISTAHDLLSKASNPYYWTVIQEVRGYIKRAGFAELRPAFLHFGGTTLTEKFLRLDKEIESFLQSDTRFSTEQKALEQLDRIKLLTTDLRGEAEFGIKHTRGMLLDDIV